MEEPPPGCDGPTTVPLPPLPTPSRHCSEPPPLPVPATPHPGRGGGATAGYLHATRASSSTSPELRPPAHRCDAAGSKKRSLCSARPRLLLLGHCLLRPRLRRLPQYPTGGSFVSGAPPTTGIEPPRGERRRARDRRHWRSRGATVARSSIRRSRRTAAGASSTSRAAADPAREEEHMVARAAAAWSSAPPLPS
jgi:hypothetical protein